MTGSSSRPTPTVDRPRDIAAPARQPRSGHARKVLLVANTAWNLHNFRRGLIRALAQEGCDVVAVCPRDRYVESLSDHGARWIDWKLDRASMNPLRDWGSVVRLRQIYREETPDLVHHFTIKSILYGTLAAKQAGVQRIVNNVTGLGHVFVSNRPAARLVRPSIRRWYRWALTTQGARPIFQNLDDLTALSNHTHELAARATLTQGSGVDLKRFAPDDSAAADTNERPCVLFAGRLLEEKGIREFVRATELNHERGSRATFVACGSPDPGNPSSIDDACLDRWRGEGLIEFPGHVDGIERQMRKADLVVLPSYREGAPRVLLEAAAMEKPVVASDVAGCRDVVTHGHNGLLVPPRDSDALADAMQTLLGDESLRKTMGRAGREMAVNKFDERTVVQQTTNLYEEMLRSEHPAHSVGEPARIEKGVMLMSFDFELAWGTRGRPAARHCKPFWEGTREAISGLLKLFERYDAPATWAIVGALLMGGKRERHPWLADASFSDIPVGNSTTHPHWYAEDILEMLASHPVNQEIGCHTLTHRFIKPGAAGRDAFREELQRFRVLCDELYLDQPTSFIYPKAKMAHFDVLVEEGFRCIRGPENKWFESLPGVRVPAAMRLVDAKLARPPRVELPERLPCGLWVLPSSQFYSPFMSVGKRVSVGQRVRKAIKGLRLAAEQNRVFHLWTHPFNLGVRSDELLDGMDQILHEARRLCDAGQLEIKTMGDMTSELDAGLPVH